MEKLGHTTIVAREDPDAADARALLEELSAVLAGITGSSGRAFYQARGYRRIANYGNYAGNALAVCFEKVLMT